MPRRKKVRADVREEARRSCIGAVTEYARMVNNTLVPDDTALVGFDEYVARVRELRPGVKDSQVYAIARAVEARQGKPLDPKGFCLPLNVGGDRQAMTMVSSFDNCVNEQLPAEQAQRKAELESLRRIWGELGRPRKD